MSAPDADKPLLGLVMIVKDEEHGIASTLATVKPFVDRWLVLDTGSTDATPEVVRKAMEGVPGEVSFEPFVDFATTRNVALERLGQQTEFSLWLDADDRLEGGHALRSFLGKERRRDAADREAYLVRVDTGIRFDSARVTRTRARWRFKGVVHEVLMHEDRPPPTVRVPDVLIRHEAPAVSAEKSRARWDRDVGLLGRATEADPNDTRSAFYLAMTLSWLGRWEESERALRRRIELGGWREEVYQAKAQLAVVAARSGMPWAEVQQRWLDAHAFAPHRAEPLHEIAAHYNAKGERALCYLFARRGYELPLPTQDILFVDEAVYRWKLADLVGSTAYWMGAFDLGERAAEQALRARPDDERLRTNLRFYRDRKKK